jgi:hypothetical protein
MELYNSYYQPTEILAGTNETIKNISGDGVYSVSGTARQISSSGTEFIYLALPQNIDSSANVIFGSLVSTVSGINCKNNLSVTGNATLSGSLIMNGSNNVVGSLTLSGTLTMYGTSSITGNLGAQGNTVYNGVVTVTGGVEAAGTFAVGPVATGAIGCRFSRGDIYNLTGGYRYYHYDSGSGQTGYYSGDSGNQAWSMEVDHRIFCHAEIDMPSDERAKTDIRTIDSNTAIEKIKALRAVSYKWNDGREDKSSKLGWIAQEVGKAGIGEALTVGPFGSINGVQIPDYHLLDRQQLVPLLWSAIAELHRKNEIIKSKLEKLT